jgi:hypothetical protein
MNLPALRSRAATWVFGLVQLASVALLLVAGPALADVELRVEGRPVNAPIQAFVTVTDANGPVPGLDEGDFTVSLDGVPLTLSAGDLTLPPALDPNQHVSVVFAMDYSVSVVNSWRTQMEDAVVNFIGAMEPGDYAAVIKYNTDSGATVVVEFTEIDGGPGNSALVDGVRSDYGGNGSNTLDALIEALQHIEASQATLPQGPKAIILVGDGGENGSTATEADVIALANELSIPIFTIGVGEFDLPGRQAMLDNLGSETSGEFYPAPDAAAIDNAYVDVSELLNNEYLITIQSGLMDCEPHVLEVAVQGQAAPATATFTRRVCDTEPDPFSFTSLSDRAPSTGATSNTVTITGIEKPAHISVINGNYSIGCAEGAFTVDPGTIENGQTVCVRHQSSSEFSTPKTTTLTVGGFAATFTTTTRADGGGGGGGDGGGGVTGLLELLLGLGGLLLARRRIAA